MNNSTDPRPGPDSEPTARAVHTARHTASHAASASAGGRDFDAAADFAPDVIVVGAGLAGMVAAYEAEKAGARVLVVDQENAANRGGQAFWSLGGLFMVDTPEQRRLGVHDSLELARRDWFGSAGFDRDTDAWPRRWASAYLDFAHHKKRAYLRNLGLKVIPMAGWAERGDGTAAGHGNSVPRFHVTWGTGPEVVRVFDEPLRAAEDRGTVRFEHRRRVDEVIVRDGRAVGVRGAKLAACDELARGVASPREVVGKFEYLAPTVLIATGGVGGNLEAVRRFWPAERLGAMPADEELVTGVPAHVDGRGIEIAQAAGARLVNRDRMWHYTEGMANWDPVWPGHGIRIIPGPSAMWFDAAGDRLPVPLIPGADTVATMRHILSTGHAYSWFILDKTIAGKEFIFSGSEQNPDLTDKDPKKLAGKLTSSLPRPIKNFLEHGEDWVVADSLEELVSGMNRVAGNAVADAPRLDVEHIRAQIEARDSQMGNNFAKDYQANWVNATRRYLGDKFARTAAPHRLLDKKHGPLIAVRLRILTRKTLGGVETDLSGRALDASGAPVPGLYAAGEASGFGGGGMHGNNSLEGTFLGGCIFSGIQAGRAMAAAAKAAR